MGSFNFNKLFKGNPLSYVGILLLFSCGGALGVFFGKTESFGFLSPLFEDYFLLVFSNGSLLSLFISRLVNNLSLCVIFSLAYLFRWLIALPILASLYRGYVFGMIMTSIVSCFGISGALICVFLLIPTQFCLQFFLTSLSVNCFCVSGRGLKEYLVTLGIFYGCCVLSALLEILSIVVFIRPLSFII